MAIRVGIVGATVQSEVARLVTHLNESGIEVADQGQVFRIESYERTYPVTCSDKKEKDWETPRGRPRYKQRRGRR